MHVPTGRFSPTALIATALFASTWLACGGSRPPPETPTEPDEPGLSLSARPLLPTPESVPSLRLPEGVTPLHYALRLRIDPRGERFEGRVAIDVELQEPERALFLHSLGLDVEHVSVQTADGAMHEAQFRALDEDGLAVVLVPEPLPAGGVRLELRYSGPFGDKLRGLYKVADGSDAYAFSQLEPISAREVFPCFDEPRFKTPFDVRIVAPEGQVAIANSHEVAAERESEGGDVVHVFDTTPPLPTYLLAFAVGPLDVVQAAPLPENEVRDRGVPFRGIAVRGRGEQMGYALEHTPAIVEALERYFDFAYPYDKLDVIAVPDFAAGAMENAGAITFREYFLLFGKEVPERQKRAFAEVMAHELAHQWFGNLVTMPFWDDLWLNEAFATWMAARIVDELWPEYRLDLDELRYTHWAMELDELQSARSIRQPVESIHDIENAFDGITYTKGGAVLNMFEQYIGADTFRAALRAYVREHAGGSATAEDLVAAMSKAAGEPLDSAFFSFLTQPGVPLVRASAACEAKRLSLELTQSRYVPLGGKPSRDAQWELPVCIAYGDARGEKRHCSMLREREAEVQIDVDRCPAYWLPNAGAEGYFRWAVSGESFGRLTGKAWGELDARERQSTVENINASLRAGEVAPQDVYPSLFRLLGEGDRHVVSTALGPLGFASDHLLDDETSRARLRQRLAAALRPSLAKVRYFPRPDEPGEVSLLRRTLVGAACMRAKDASCRQRMGDAGRVRLGLAEAQNARELPADLIAIALEVAVQDGGTEAFDAAEAHLFASDDSIERSRLLTALGSVTEPSLAERARALSLDPRLKVNEVPSILHRQAREPALRQATWEWAMAHLDALARRSGGRAGGRLASLASGFCSAQAAAQVRASFGPHAATFVGGPRELETTVEGIELCAAQAAALRESARAFFAK